MMRLLDLFSGAGGAADAASVVAKRLKERMADLRAVWGIPWGFPGLDKLTGGIHEGEVTILAARPRVGKTTIMAQVADSVCTYLAGEEGAAKYPKHVLKLVMCESSAEVFQQRLLCFRARVSIRKVREGRLTAVQFERYKQAAREFCTLPIRYLDDANSLDAIGAFLADRREPACWWALDYLQKIPSVSGRANDGRVAATNLISTALTELGRRVAPGLVLSQLTRAVDQREEGAPSAARCFAGP